VLLLAALTLAACGSPAPLLPELPAVAEGEQRAAWSAPIAISSDDQWVYVVNTDAGSVTAVDTETDAPLWELSLGGEPRSIALDPRGSRAYVTRFADATTSVIDLTAGTELATLETGRHPYGVVVSPEGRRLFVAESAANTIAIFDTDTLERLGQVPVEPNPRGLAVSSDGTQLYVTHFLSGRVSVIDVGASAVVAVISTGAESTQRSSWPSPRTASERTCHISARVCRTPISNSIRRSPRSSPWSISPRTPCSARNCWASTRSIGR